MKRKICFLLIAIIMLCLSGCKIQHQYRGQYIELYSAAIYSIPNACGYFDAGEYACDPDIYVWEKDEYGRVLFSYCEDCTTRVFALVVSQSYDESAVYFYPDVNYVLCLMESDGWYAGGEEEYLKTRTEAFYLENRNKLKEDNDWSKPQDKTKCISYPISASKVFEDKVTSLSCSQCDDILNEYSKTLNLANPETKPYRYNEILQVDAEGRVLHLIHGVHRHFDNPDWKKSDKLTFYDIDLLVITDKEGNYDKENGILVLYSKANESDPAYIYDAGVIKEFKENNNWEYGFCEP
ncbi:MAG: hypothetical protein J6T65_05995 [Clostridia bacterium]|nr:hypothetical protein [Clostridia bacterium]